MNQSALSILSILAMSAGIASCSDDEQMSAASADCTESIGFGMPASRVLDDETFDTFYVYGGFWRATDAWNQTYSPVFVGRKVSRLSGSSHWDYENYEKWLEGMTYKFYAIGMETDQVPSAVKTSAVYVYDQQTGVGKTDYPIVLDNIVIDGSWQSDIVYAESDEIAGRAPGWNDMVRLHFDHILSNVKVRFVNESGAEAVTVSDVSIEHFYNRSSYGIYYTNGVAERQWSQWPDNESRKQASIGLKFDGAESVSVGTRAETDEVFLIPYDYTSQYASGLGEQWAVTIRYTVSDDSSSRREYTAKIAPVWEEGRSYAYNIVVGTPDNQSS